MARYKDTWYLRGVEEPQYIMAQGDFVSSSWA